MRPNHVRLSIALLFASAALAQQQSVTEVRFLDSAGTNYVSLRAPASLSGNYRPFLPATDGSANQCLETDGSGNWSFQPCSSGLTPPVTISGSTSGVIFTVTQSGAGSALAINGTSAFSGLITASGGVSGAIGATGPSTGAFTTLSASSTVSGTGFSTYLASPPAIGGAAPGHVSTNLLTISGSTAFAADNSYNVGGPTLAPALIYTHKITGTNGTTAGVLPIDGTATFSNKAQSDIDCVWPTITVPCWYNDEKGIATAQDVTVRYTFNSAADQAQIGTYTFSGTTLTTSVTVDLAWVGGQIYLCPTTCTTTNGTYYPITAYLGPNALTISGTPGAAGSFSYSAYAFQTSQGTMYITGQGFGYFKNLVASNGFTAVGTLPKTGVVTVSGTAVTRLSGDLFDPSMLGGRITINTTVYNISSDTSAILTPSRLTLTTSAGSGAFTYSYIGDAVRSCNGTLACNGYIDWNGNGIFHDLSGSSLQNRAITTAGIVTSDTDGFLYQSGPISFGSAYFTGNLPTGNLDSGTNANSSNFWRGDGHWGPAGTVGPAGPTGPPGPMGPIGPTGPPAGQPVAPTDSPTFAAATLGHLDIATVGTVIDSAANYLANSLKITGISTTGTGGHKVCVDGSTGLLFYVVEPSLCP